MLKKARKRHVNPQSHSSRCADHSVIAKLLRLSHDAIALAGRRAWRGLVLSAAVGRLRRLKFDTVLLAIVALVLAAAVVASIVGLSAIRGRGRLLVVVVGLRIVVARSCGPACAVEGLAACLATTTSCQATKMTVSGDCAMIAVVETCLQSTKRRRKPTTTTARTTQRTYTTRLAHQIVRSSRKCFYPVVPGTSVTSTAAEVINVASGHVVLILCVWLVVWWNACVDDRVVRTWIKKGSRDCICMTFAHEPNAGR